MVTNKVIQVDTAAGELQDARLNESAEMHNVWEKLAKDLWYVIQGKQDSEKDGCP